MELFHEIKKSFPKMERIFNQKTLLELRHTPECGLAKYNIGLGTIIRLTLLNPKNKLYKNFSSVEISDKYKMSMKIICEFHKYLNDKN